VDLLQRDGLNNLSAMFLYKHQRWHIPLDVETHEESGGVLQHLMDALHETHKKDGRGNVVFESSQMQVCRHASDLRIS
jgi:hypothetical protein